MICEHPTTTAELTETTPTGAFTVGLGLPRPQARVELVEALLAGRDECHVAIRNRPGFLGVNRLLSGKNHSWIHIERNRDGTFDLMWTSSRDTHQPLKGPAYSVGISDTGQVISLYQSAISMWMKYHHQCKPEPAQRERAETIANRMFGFMRMCGIAEA